VRGRGGERGGRGRDPRKNLTNPELPCTDINFGRSLSLFYFYSNLTVVCLEHLIRLNPTLNTAVHLSVGYVSTVAATFEPLLVLSFSVERLIAIVRPLQVCRSRYTLSVIVC